MTLFQALCDQQGSALFRCAAAAEHSNFRNHWTKSSYLRYLKIILVIVIRGGCSMLLICLEYLVLLLRGDLVEVHGF